jgi:hypothetical protein
MLSYCLFCSAPTANPHGFCSEECYDGHAVALEETQLIPALPDDECPLCGPADCCTCSYLPADTHRECEFCGEVFCVCERGSKWDDVDDEFYYEPPDCDLWNER